MSHRHDAKQARREERLRAEALARRANRRQTFSRRGAYGAIAAIAATLVALAVVLNGGESTPADHAPAAVSSGGAGAEVGATAPDFALTDVVSGKTVSAASLRGRKTLLFFSEGVNCQACMVQAADLEKDRALEKAGIDLVSVTTDQPADLADAARQYGIRAPLLADPTTRMSSAYGMLGHGGMGHPTQDGHAFMLVGADGKVLWHKAFQEMYVERGRLLRDIKERA